MVDAYRPPPAGPPLSPRTHNNRQDAFVDTAQRPSLPVPPPPPLTATKGMHSLLPTAR